jgi:murein DD-endopeptidase MepM/ murein hydrolase activator NlpD
MRRLLIAIVLAGLATAPVAPHARAAGDWTWPVTGVLLRGFDPPDSPYGSGHRGIDIAGSPGTIVIAPADGVVTFAGSVGGRLFLTIDHGGGLESTYSWLDAVLVQRNDLVRRGDPVARSGWGHTGALIPHLHLGVRLADVYVDPLEYLGPFSVSGFLRLAPVPI